MAPDLIRYDLLVQEALRGVVKTVLAGVAGQSLPGEHHCYITFTTTAPGVRISPALQQRFPQDMTIVLQHQFRDLAVSDLAFEVKLHFSGVPERVLVPFAAIVRFEDPSVGFILRFEQIDGQPRVAEKPAAAPSPMKAVPSAKPGKNDPEPTRLTAAETALPQAKREPRKETAEKIKDSAPEPKAKPIEPKIKPGDSKIVSIDAFRKKP
jgi:hypothetical protein